MWSGCGQLQAEHVVAVAHCVFDKLFCLFVCSLAGYVVGEVHYLMEFLCDRVKDQVLILPHVLAGIRALVSALATNLRSWYVVVVL